MKLLLLWVGCGLPIISTAIYIRDIIYGSVRPQRMTRFLMFLIAIISWAALVAGQDRAGVWLALVSLLQTIVLLGLSFKWGIGGRDWLDFVCLLLCAIGIGLWLASRQSLFGLVLSILADLLACVPSLVMSWRLPHTELAAFYWLDVVASACVAAAAPLHWQAQLYPGYLVLINTVFGLAIWHGRRKQRKIIPTSRRSSDTLEV